PVLRGFPGAVAGLLQLCRGSPARAAQLPDRLPLRLPAGVFRRRPGGVEPPPARGTGGHRLGADPPGGPRTGPPRWVRAPRACRPTPAYQPTLAYRLTPARRATRTSSWRRERRTQVLLSRGPRPTADGTPPTRTRAATPSRRTRWGERSPAITVRSPRR